jgi:GxxExxY protein
MKIRIEDMMKEIYAELGPGYSERVYHNAIEVRLRELKAMYESERIIPIYYRGHVIGNLRADIIINGKIVLEFKTIKTLTDGAELQAHNYLRLTGLRKAYLVNFPPHPGREVEVRKIELGPSEEELESEFGKILEHHQSVSSDRGLPRLTIPEPTLDDTWPVRDSTSRVGQGV